MTSFEDELEKSGFIAFTNKGSSMMPLLRQDRDVMVILSKKTGFQKNDAVLYKRKNGQYVLHRITKINGDGTYFIIGDNCEKGETICENQIFGILSQINRDGKVISVTDKDYLKYVRRIPLRRALFRIERPTKRFLYKIYSRTFKRK